MGNAGMHSALCFVKHKTNGVVTNQLQTSPARNGKLDGKGGRMCGMEKREAMGYGLICEVCTVYILFCRKVRSVCIVDVCIHVYI